MILCSMEADGIAPDVFFSCTFMPLFDSVDHLERCKLSMYSVRQCQEGNGEIKLIWKCKAPTMWVHCDIYHLDVQASKATSCTNSAQLDAAIEAYVNIMVNHLLSCTQNHEFKAKMNDCHISCASLATMDCIQARQSHAGTSCSGSVILHGSPLECGTGLACWYPAQSAHAP